VIETVIIGQDRQAAGAIAQGINEVRERRRSHRCRPLAGSRPSARAIDGLGLSLSPQPQSPTFVLTPFSLITKRKNFQNRPETQNSP
jgi:hypothetical protein